MLRSVRVILRKWQTADGATRFYIELERKAGKVLIIPPSGRPTEMTDRIVDAWPVVGEVDVDDEAVRLAVENLIGNFRNVDTDTGGTTSRTGIALSAAVQERLESGRNGAERLADLHRAALEMDVGGG